MDFVPRLNVGNEEVRKKGETFVGLPSYTCGKLGPTLESCRNATYTDMIMLQ